MTPPALQHLFDRGLTEASVADNRYGYCDDRAMSKLIAEFGKDEVIESGLWKFNEEKGYDFAYFGGRIIIPWMKGSQYVTFQGRALSPDARKRYLFLPGKNQALYHGEDLFKSGRVYLTEGALKRDRLAQEGVHAVALAGATNFRAFVDDLNRCDDLWIVLDSDANHAGQNAAREMVAAVNKCTLVTLPLQDGEEKIGVDDFIEEYGFEAFVSLPSVCYERGIEVKPTHLSVIVSAWRKQVEAAEQKGFLTNFKRLDSWMEGFHEGTLTFIAGAPHMGKSMLMEEIELRLFHSTQDLIIDHYSNDDSLFTTITRLVAKLGRLQPRDCRYPMLAFADDPESMEQFQMACARLESMSDRLHILDRSYNVTLEHLRENLRAWRKENPRTKRILLIDAFTKTKTLRDTEFRDQISASIYRSALLKDIAQEAHIPVIVTHEVPKLNGKRPNSWNLKESSTLEYDADVILLCYQEAHIRGLDGTNIRIDYDAGYSNPVLEVIIGKDKICGTPRSTDLFEIDKHAMRLRELKHDEYRQMMDAVRESERSEWKR